jgi:hypothetical protein
MSGGDPLDVTLQGGLFGGAQPAGGARPALALDELLQRLTALLRAQEGCENASVIGLTRLDPPDSEGCNWSASIVLDPAGARPEVYALAYAAMIGEARRSWNLA